jgi:thiol-disulfide isomerase/thioredoxin
MLEGLLKNGKVTIVLIYADWCGACHRFRKNVWGPMCKKGAVHNRAAIEESQLKNSSLEEKVNIEHFPSVIVVNEKGEVEDIPKPDGTMTNAIPTPKTPEEMVRIVNTPLTPLPANAVVESATPLNLPVPRNALQTPSTIEPLVVQGNTKKATPNLGTPEGKTYIPTLQTAPPVKQAGGACPCSGMRLFGGGGALLRRLESYSSGTPAVRGRTRRLKRN